MGENMGEIFIRNKNTYSGDGVYIGRGSPLGNPFKITNTQLRKVSIDRYAIWIKEAILNEGQSSIDRDEILSELTRLFNILRTGNLNLICYCSPHLCHGEIIKQLLTNRYYHGSWLVRNEIGIRGL